MAFLNSDLRRHPGAVSCRADGQLDHGGDDERGQDSWRHVAPHVIVEQVGPEPEHVLQVLHEPVRR